VACVAAAVASQRSEPCSTTSRAAKRIAGRSLSSMGLLELVPARGLFELLSADVQLSAAVAVATLVLFACLQCFLSRGPAPTAEIGVVGLGVMGSQLCLNLAEKLEGSAVAGFDLDAAKADAMAKAAAEQGGLNVQPTTSLKAFVRSLKRPRKILLLVPAGKAVDSVIGSLKPLLSRGDLVIDMGNEWYERTERRSAQLIKSGLLYMGCGTSGGESGARHGPCLMPGGSEAGWQLVKTIFEGIAAKAGTDEKEGGGGKYPCVRYIGPGGAGQYVKMVHNGIEYGDMQLIGEAAHLCRAVGGLDAAQVGDLFEKFNRGVLASYLVEISAQIYRKADDGGGKAGGGSGALVDQILDSSGSKGTGKWTIQEAAELGVPAPTISAALEARFVSSLKPQRLRAAEMAQPGGGGGGAAGGGSDGSDSRRLSGGGGGGGEEPERPGWLQRRGWEEHLEDALYCAKLCSYAQGMAHLRAASDERGWRLKLAELAQIWQGGCIIRARCLDLVRAAYEREPTLPNLLLDPEIAAQIARRAQGWRRLVSLAVQSGVPVPALSGSLAYYDAMRCATLPSAQCVQAQRDFFGGHGFKRLDADGTFHAHWG